MDGAIVPFPNGDLVEPTPVWDRQPGEPLPAFRAFRVYLALGITRTLKSAAETNSLGKASRSKTLIRQYGFWARSWNWRTRAEQFDDWEWSQREVEWEKRRREAQESRLEIAQLQIAKALQRLATLNPLELDPDQTLRLLQAGLQNQRTEFTPPTERTANGDQGKVPGIGNLVIYLPDNGRGDGPGPNRELHVDLPGVIRKSLPADARDLIDMDVDDAPLIPDS